MKKGILIGIAVASGSGKSLLAESISKNLGSDKIVIIQEDSYYRDLSDVPTNERATRNFDHPDAFDHTFLANHLAELLKGESISCPIYDYKIHNRTQETKTVDPRPFVLLEGILIFSNARLRDLMDYRLYVDTALDICLLRRLRRDINERGRTLESVIQQYQKTVRPMFFQFVNPSKQYADILIPGGGKNTVAIDMITTKLDKLLHGPLETNEKQ